MTSCLMTVAELEEKINSFDIPADEKEPVVNLLRKKELREEQAADWLAWCSGNNRVKVQEYPVPLGIFPPGYLATIHDVKVFSKGRPDDSIYNSCPDIRKRIARGNTVLTYHDPATGRKTIDMVIFALKKFTGGMGDEDEDQPENDLVWQRYFLRPIQEVSSIVVTNKENGEAAHFSVRYINDDFYLIAGSKNVHLVFRTREDIARYTDSRRFLVAAAVAEAVVATLAALQPDRRRLLLSFMARTRVTAVLEILLPSYQHVVDLSYLSEPRLKFLCWTRQYSEEMEEETSLTSLPPHAALDLASRLGLDSTSYEVIEVKDFESKMVSVRRGYGYEGCVLYFMDNQNHVVGLLKKKTTWYICCRAIREKVSNLLTAYKKNPGGFGAQEEKQHIHKLFNRLDEIQKWLGLSQVELTHWRKLGSTFLTWSLREAKKSKNTETVNTRGKFPQAWCSFLKETGQSDNIALNGDHHGSGDADPEEEEEEDGKDSAVRLLGPSGGSPRITLQHSAHQLCITSCIVRNLDLMGKNLGKVASMINKINSRQAKDRTLGFLCAHDLAKVESQQLTFAGGPLSDTLLIAAAQSPAGGFDSESAAALRDRLTRDTRSSQALRQHLRELEAVGVLSEGDKVLSLDPLASSEVTRPEEDTTELLVVASAISQEIGDKLVHCLLQQLFHSGIGASSGRKKSLLVEKVQVVDSQGAIRTYPTSLDSKMLTFTNIY